VQPSQATNTDEHVNTRKRKELLSELKDIIQEKKNNDDDVDADDREDSFVFSPPRKVRLKYRRGANKNFGDVMTCDNTTSSPASVRNSYSCSPNSEQRKQPSEDAAENYSCIKTESKRTLLGHSSKRRSQPLISPRHKRKFSDDKRMVLGPHESSASESERVISKRSKESLLRHSRLDRNDRSNYRALRTYSHSSSKDCYDEERIQQLKKSSEVLQEQHTSRFERERVFKVEPSWQQSPEEASWQERDSAPWLEENTDNRCNEPLQFDLRQKLIARRQYRNQHYRDEEVLFDDPPVNQFGEARHCRLRAPPSQPHCDDVPDEYDIDRNIYNDTQRRHCHDQLDNTFPQGDDNDSWMNVDRRHLEYSNSSLEEEPHHTERHREVRQYFSLFTF